MSFNEWLKSDKIILFDGGMGTEVFKRGIKPGKLPDLINIEHPEVITEIHKAYYEAGSDMCQTNTFGASLLNLENYKAGQRIQEINERALENIKKACPPDHLIVGDIGPSGVFKPPIGKTTFEEWKLGFQEQAKYLESGVDLWHIETMSDIDEILAAIEGIKTISTKPIIGSMTFKKTKRGYFTIMGNPLEKSILTLENAKIDVVGANCTLGSDQMVDLVKELKDIVSIPFSIKPNAGQPRVDENQIAYYDQPVDEFIQDIGKIIDLGAKIVGGCCGSSPKTIEKIRILIDSL